VVDQPAGFRSPVLQRHAEQTDAALASLMSVGIFWWVEDALLLDQAPLAQAEPYGPALQHGGHWEFHEGLTPRTLREESVKQQPYDVSPRGRVVYFPAQAVAVVYLNRCLNTPAVRAAITEAFGLTGDVRFSGDPHYRCPAFGSRY
jgi:hypothetical protein